MPADAVESCIIRFTMTDGTEPNAAFEESSYALAFETSSAQGCVALGRGSSVLSAAGFSRPRAHAVEFLPTVDALCRAQGVEPNQIEWVFVSAGPGSFTGLRIGITAARMIALAIGSRVVAIPTLEVIAQNALDSENPPDQVAVVVEAKRKRVYTATFEHRGANYVELNEPREADPLAYLSAQSSACSVLGEGVLYHREAIAASGRLVLPESLFPPRAETVYHLGAERARRGKTVAARSLVPVYIRPPEAEEVLLARHGSPTG